MWEYVWSLILPSYVHIHESFDGFFRSLITTYFDRRCTSVNSNVGINGWLGDFSLLQTAQIFYPRPLWQTLQQWLPWDAKKWLGANWFMPLEGSQLPASPSRFKMKHHETEPSTPKEIQKITEPVTTMDKSSNVRSSGHTIKLPIIGYISYIQNRLSRRLLSFGESRRCNPTSGSCCTRTKFIPKCILKFIGHLTEIWYSSISIYISPLVLSRALSASAALCSSPNSL